MPGFYLGTGWADLTSRADALSHACPSVLNIFIWNKHSYHIKNNIKIFMRFLSLYYS